MNCRRIMFVGALMLCSWVDFANAQDAPTSTPQPGEELTVYLMTMSAGDPVYEKFGHTAIWIHDARAQTDVAYNWGLFDFNDRDFIPRLAAGEMRYSMAGFEMHQMLQFYITTNRHVWAQELNLRPDQRAMIRALAELNALPQNRYYTYDYYRNNCSTLPRDLIDQVVSGAIRFQTKGIHTGSSFRSHTLRLLGNDLLPYAGAQFALGHPSDIPISKWQEMFLPLKLQEHIRKVSMIGTSGNREPLVTREFTMFAAKRAPDPASAPHHVIRFTLLGAGFAALLVVLLSLSLTGLRTTKVLLGIIATLWALVAGLAGTGLILAWTATNHFFMSRNENLFQFNPLLLGLAVCIPLAFKVVRLQKPVVIMACVAAGLSLCGFVLQLLPSFDQPNGEIIGLALPIHLAMAMVCLFLFQKTTSRPSSADL